MPNSVEVTYGYRPEDITVLKDDPDFPIHLQPTRENIVSPFILFYFHRSSLARSVWTDFGIWAGFSCAN